MAFQLSPGINVTEVDLTTIVPSVATSIGGIAGPFAWGPIGEIVTISDEIRLADRFGKPDSTTYEYWFTAANFLAYTNNLKVVRVSGSGTYSATGNSTATILIKNDDDWENNWSGGAANVANTLPYGTFAARYAGALGNSLKVSMADANTFSGWTYKTVPSVTIAPSTSAYANTKGASHDELHIVVIDEDGQFSGTRGTVLETFPFCSKASDAKDSSGNNTYYKDVIARKSKYIHWLSHPSSNTLISGSQLGNLAFGATAAANTYANLISELTVSLSGGADGTIVTANTVGANGTGYSAFNNKEDVDVSFLLAGPAGETVIEALISTAETRKDLVVFVSPEKADVVDNAGNEATDTVAFRNTLTSSNYVFMDCNWKYQYDKYNDVYRWIPMNGDIAGLCARTDLERDPWYSPGGLNRGIIKNVIKTAWNPNKTDRDTLYVNSVNPVVTFRGEGTVLFGDKTMTAKPSAFDRINVRRLFIVLEKAIERATRYSLFEFNDQFTRAQFVALVEPFLRDVQGRRGITDFRVVCDDTNNTGEIIDRNEFVGDIFIKPARSINFIQLNFIAVRTGVSFNEVVGKLY